MADDRFGLAQAFSRSHPLEAADVMGLQPRQAGTEFLTAIESPASVGLLNAMPPPDAAAFLSEMDGDTAVALIGSMAPQRAANVIRLLPTPLSRRARREQSAVRRSQIQFYLRQAKGVVGAWIESNVITARTSETVGDLRMKVSRYEGTVPTVYVTDADQSLHGTVTAAALVAAHAQTAASEIMEPAEAILRARTPIELAVKNAAWRQADLLPVAEANNAFLGVVRYATLRHAIDDLADGPAPETSAPSAMGLADAWFLGLSEILSASLGRPATQPAKRDSYDGGQP